MARKRSERWDHWVEPEPEPEPEEKAADYVDAREPDPWTELRPWFPIGGVPFTPRSECPHAGPIAEGDPRVCMVCHAAGKDGTKALPLDVEPLPPEPRPAQAEPEPLLSRKDRRKLRREAEREYARARAS
jgi:hypothetical protein